MQVDRNLEGYLRKRRVLVVKHDPQTRRYVFEKENGLGRQQ